MPDGHEAITIRVVDRISDLAPEHWDACAGRRNPFVRHAFLSALEESGSASRETGWLPQHLVVPDRNGGLLGAVPLYLKSHSYGEYIFDWAWANAYERAGGRYYPKLQCCVPFTPATGPRLLVHPDADYDFVAGALIAGLDELTRAHEASSLHVTFAESWEWERLAAADFLPRIGIQYHWANPGYHSFDDFLGTLVSRKRKMIRKERRSVTESGVRLRPLLGPEIRPEHWRAFYGFYLSTIDRKWAHAYLTQAFFELLGERLKEDVLLLVAEDGGEIVASALNLVGEEALYGRYWGCSGNYRFLHFEACYYQAMDFAIARGLGRVEAGAQGEHKIQRGYLPQKVFSAHQIRDPGFRSAIEDFLRRETLAVDHEIRALAELSPFRKCQNGET